jgi:hypothetical protein
MKKIVRRILLVGAPKLTDSWAMHLGISNDIERMKQHFTSAYGGGFIEGEELRDGYRPTLEWWLKQLEWMKGADYAVIYFSGHGNSQNGKPYIALTENELFPVGKLMNLATRQLVITDSCLDEVEPYSNFSGGGLRGLGEQSWFDLAYARRIFNEIIAQSPACQVLIQSSSYNQSSIGFANGGVFTNAFLDVVSGFVAKGTYELLTSTIAFKRAKMQVEHKTNGKQNPRMISIPNPLELGLPVAINPFVIHRKHPTLAQQQSVTKSDNTGWWILGGFATAALLGLIASGSGNRKT